MTRVAPAAPPARALGAGPALGVAPPLPGGAVHLWRASLTTSEAEVARMRQDLSTDEHARAARFRWARDRRRFVVGRAFLRSVLGAYLHRAPASVPFAYGPAGKPMLPGDDGAPDLRFNAARSGDQALLVVAGGRSVGVDLERVRPIAELDEVADVVLSARERAALRALPPGARQEAFLRAWTRKEAVVKGAGAGLVVPPDTVEVPLEPGEGPWRVTLGVAPGTAAAWSVQGVEVGHGYVAALAVAGSRPVAIQQAAHPRPWA